MDLEEIKKRLPYEFPFLFVDELTHVNETGAGGNFTFKKSLEFYRGHFKNNPITPGVILTECCAQIGLVALGIFLLSKDKSEGLLKIGLSSSEMEFLNPVLPGERVVVTSKKVYFRFNKLKCEVKMHNAKGNLVCKGIVAGMIINDTNG